MRFHTSASPRSAGLALAATLVVALGAAGCSGGGSGGGAAATAAPVQSAAAFRLLAVEPADGAAAVATTAVVRLTFGGEVDPRTVTPGGVELTTAAGPVACTIAFQRGAGTASIVELRPAAPLAGGTLHELRVAATVADSGGAALGQDLLTTFTTEVPPPAPAPAASDLRAGAAVVDVTPPVGVPLGGFGDPPRRRTLPDIDPTNYHTFFEPSTGVLDPILCKALVLERGGERYLLLTLDVIATAARTVEDIQARAAARGVVIPLENMIVCSSHTHGGPGALSDLRFWQLVAMDLYQDRVYDAFVSGCVDAVVQAHANLAPASFAADSVAVRGLTKNRRAGDSRVFTRDSIDPELGVLRFDRLDGTPIATVWNFAVHGLIYWNDNMRYTADLFGHVARYVEAQGGGVCLFANGAEGDQVPDGRGAQDGDRIGHALATEILRLRGAMTPTTAVEIVNRSEWIDFGAASVSVDVSRLGRSGSGNRFVQLLQAIPGFTLGIGISLDRRWLETRFRYQAMRINDVAIATIPGEAIHSLGLEVKAHGAAKGYRRTFVFGLANGHMSYIATPDEYDAGGYESIATFFGRDTGRVVADECKKLLDIVR